jgi:hypothetical protein
MTRAIVFGTLLLWALAAGAQARDWGFDKDTVYEWKAVGDTALLVNNSSQSLLVDSFLVEMVFPDMDTVILYFQTRNPTQSHYWYPVFPAPNTLGFSIPSQASKVFRGFQIDRQLGEIVSQKASASLGDTLAARLRVLAGGQEDTLIVMGTLQFIPTSLGRDRSLRGEGMGIMNRDILGRDLKTVPNFPALIRTPGK